MTALVQSAIRWHRAYTWPERLTIAGLVGLAILRAVAG